MKNEITNKNVKNDKIIKIDKNEKKNILTWDQQTV